jgi:hypothetical protein
VARQETPRVPHWLAPRIADAFSKQASCIFRISSDYACLLLAMYAVGCSERISADRLIPRWRKLSLPTCSEIALNRVVAIEDCTLVGCGSSRDDERRGMTSWALRNQQTAHRMLLKQASNGSLMFLGLSQSSPWLLSCKLKVQHPSDTRKPETLDASAESASSQ